MQIDWVRRELLAQNKKLRQDMPEMVFNIPQLIVDAVKHETPAGKGKGQHSKLKESMGTGVQSKECVCAAEHQGTTLPSAQHI
ncbi:UNVERIFIED_CONTAM: hypothetical protein K2H54_019737 [Gekko kuhli]